MDHLLSLPAPLEMNSLLRRVCQNENNLTAYVIVTNHTHAVTPLRDVDYTDVLVAAQTPKEEEELLIPREI